MARIGIWTALIGGLAASTYFMQGWEAFKSLAQFMIYWGGGCFFAYSFIVEPIQKQVQALEYKLDYDLQRLREHLHAISNGLNADRQERRDIRMRDHFR
jgi:hypothetical protein